jgi:hypothetical protein
MEGLKTHLKTPRQKKKKKPSHSCRKEKKCNNAEFASISFFGCFRGVDFLADNDNPKYAHEPKHKKTAQHQVGGFIPHE